MFCDFNDNKKLHKNIEKRADKNKKYSQNNFNVNIFMGRSGMFKLITKNYKVRNIYQIIS